MSIFMETESLKNTIQEYDKANKIREGIIKIAIISVLSALIIAHFLGITKGTIIESIINSLGSQFNATNLNNVFFVGLIGGLFFLSVPLEALFITAIINIHTNPVAIMFAMMLGLSISYTINYVMGKYMSGIATKLVSPKKFYKIKVLLNKYGKGLIFLFNVLPLPSQILTFICGVFKYNKTRYFSIWGAGWLIKLSLIIIFRPQILEFVNILKSLFI